MNCSSCSGCCSVTRRSLFQAAAVVPAAISAKAAAPTITSGRSTPPARVALRVQPVVIYQISKRRPQTSWRPWGAIESEAQASEEKGRIDMELAAMKKAADFPVEFLPLRTARTVEEAAAAGQGEHDGVLMYPICGGVQLLDAVSKGNPWTLVFVRHRSGPVYEWYEIVHPRFLRKTVDEWNEAPVRPADVVVDEPKDVLMRLRALTGLKNTLGKKIVCVGGPAGWGQGGKQAPQLATNLFRFSYANSSYEEIGTRLARIQADNEARKRARVEAADYLKQPGVRLETNLQAVENAFLVRDVFLDLMNEAGTDAMTINNCMSKIMPISETTACLSLSLLNDAGYQAYCESDFVVIPSGVLLHGIAGLPVFLNDPTYPHHGIVTLAHCTAPRRMDGKNMEPVRVLTHFESDYGAAPKVEMRKGQKLTNIVPDFSFKKWVGFEGEIVGNPFLPICRSQIDVGIAGDERKLVEEMRGFHWMSGYGNYLDETGYALSKVGIEWLNVSGRTT